MTPRSGDIHLITARRAARLITSINPRFDDIIKSSGLCTIGARSGKRRPGESNFAALASSILSQQLSTKAAATIINRVEILSGGSLQPKRIVELKKSQLRSAGCSDAKTRAISELAHATVKGEIPMSSLHRLTDEEIMEHLLPRFGIGRWTVEMFLMFQLGRDDIWPVGDLGVRRGWEKIHRMRTEIEPKKLEILGARYAPYRSHLAWYCWRAVEIL
ncbi:MAG: DNA-3-methyladenine glycosylase family protein [Actinomycetota bacterium]